MGHPRSPAAVLHHVEGARFRASDLPSGRAAVLFSADWCGYSRRFLSHFQRLKQAWVVDISDESDPLWDTYAIRVVPTVLLFEDGKPVRRWAGVLVAAHADEVWAALSEASASPAP